MKKVLVTGAKGYIGAHAVKVLSEHGYDVYGLDKRTDGMGNDVAKYVSGMFDTDIEKFTPPGSYDHIVHLAGYISVEESETSPSKYIRGNIIASNKILRSEAHNDSINVTFASSATVDDPSSVYSYTKLLAEKIIKEKSTNFTNLRFFNVAGNNGEFRQHGPATHLIRIAAKVAAGKLPSITINGTDWNTPDGTCVRDYVHVMDVVSGIVKSIDTPSSNDFDYVGTGTGYSVREVIASMKKVSGKDFEVIEGPRRPGDIASITMPDGTAKYVETTFNLEDMCLSAYQAELK